MLTLETFLDSAQVYIYLSVLFFAFLVIESFHSNSRAKNVTAFFSMTLLILITGLRWETGTDWYAYKNLFDTITFSWSHITTVYGFDIGYVIFNAIIRTFTSNYTVFLVLDSLIAIFPLYLLFRKYAVNPNISVFVFYNTFFVSQFMGSNRRMISLVFGLFAVIAFYDRDLKRALRSVVFAFSFHRTALVLLASKFVPKQALAIKYILIFLVTTFVLGFFNLPFKLMGELGNLLSSFSSFSLVEKLQFYSNEEYSKEVISENLDPGRQMALSVMKRLVFLVFYIFILYKKPAVDNFTKYLFNLYVLGFGIYMLFNGSPVFQILSTYFTFTEIILLSRFWEYTSARLKTGFIVFLFFYGLLQLFSALSPYPELYLPYRSIFDF